jgi:hypothetical protein
VGESRLLQDEESKGEGQSSEPHIDGQAFFARFDSDKMEPGTKNPPEPKKSRHVPHMSILKEMSSEEEDADDIDNKGRGKRR